MSKYCINILFVVLSTFVQKISLVSMTHFHSLCAVVLQACAYWPVQYVLIFYKIYKLMLKVQLPYVWTLLYCIIFTNVQIIEKYWNACTNGMLVHLIYVYFLYHGVVVLYTSWIIRMLVVTFYRPYDNNQELPKPLMNNFLL